MRKFQLLLSALALPLLLVLQLVPAHAQASRTWISGVGDDVNPCSRTAPCKTFAGAISKTAVNGEIDCLDAGGFGSLTITKSITLDCHQTLGSILNAGTNGINIAYDNFGSGDVRKTVRLRGLSIEGADTGVVGIRITGGTNSTNSAVFIEQCVIDGNYGGTAIGISDERSGGGELYIADTTVRNTNSAAITVNPRAGTAAGARIDVSIDNVRAQNSIYGFSAGSGTRTMITRSVFSGNSTAGIEANAPFTATQVNVDNSVTSGNGTGVVNDAGPGGTTIVLSNTDVTFNGTALAGTVQSFGNNRISGNGTAGTAPPTPVGPASPAMGQQ
jgi:hypothetical protein